jgi:hypothetical protein
LGRRASEYYCLAIMMWQNLTPWIRACSATQEIPRILWNPKVHYPVHKSAPTVCILSHMNPTKPLRFVLIISSHLPLGLPHALHADSE